MDEPVSGINDDLIKKIINIVNAIKEFGKTILLIEHNTDFIKEVSDKIFFLMDGLTSTFNNYDQFKGNKNVQEVY